MSRRDPAGNPVSAPGVSSVGGNDLSGVSVDALLASARRRLTRLTPQEAAAELQRGALLVDTRSSEQRQRDGEVPGSIVVDRNVLEWRLDPTSPNRIPQLTDRESTVIVMCNEGYSSSLAAAMLRRLGLRNVRDVAGGFQAWVAAGLPVQIPQAPT